MSTLESILLGKDDPNRDDEDDSDVEEVEEKEGPTNFDVADHTHPQNKNDSSFVIGAQQILASPVHDGEKKSVASTTGFLSSSVVEMADRGGSILQQVAGATTPLDKLPKRVLDAFHDQTTGEAKATNTPSESDSNTCADSSDEAYGTADTSGNAAYGTTGDAAMNEGAPSLSEEGTSSQPIKRKRGRPKGSKTKNHASAKKPKATEKLIRFADPDVQRRLEEYRRKKNERSKKYRRQQKIIEEAKAAGEEIPVFKEERTYESDPLAKIPDFHCKDGMVWEVEDIPLTVATSLTDDTPMTINFADTIGCIDGKKMRWVDGQEKLYLPSEFNQNNPEWRRTVLGKAFNKACLMAGTKVVMYGWEPLKLNAKFGCYRCRRRSSAEPLSKSLKATLHSDLCRFSFHVYWDDAVNRWYVKKLGAGCKIHTGHEPILNLQEFRQKSRQRIQSRLEELPLGSVLRNRLARRGRSSQKKKSNKQTAIHAKAENDSQDETDNGDQNNHSDTPEMSEDSALPNHDYASVVDVTQTYRKPAPVNNNTVRANSLDCIPDTAASAIVGPCAPVSGPVYSMTHDLFAEVTTLISEPSDAIHLKKMLLDFKEYMQKKSEAQRGVLKDDEDRTALRSTQNGYIYYHV